MASMKYIDEEEKELIQSIKEIDIDKIQNDKSNIETLKKAAQDYIAKQDKQISLRMSSEDLSKLKTIASKKGIRYQTLIKSIIHQYINNHENASIVWLIYSFLIKKGVPTKQPLGAAIPQ